MTARHPVAPLVKGLFTEGAHQIPPSVTNEMLGVNISQLVSKPGGEVIAGNPLDHWLARGADGGVRIYFGRGPGAASLNGDWLALGAVTVHDPTDGVTSSVNRWWEPVVQQAQHDAVAKIAAMYDPLISLVYIANGGTTYAEPYIRGIGSADTRHALIAAGYTIDVDQASYPIGWQMFNAFKFARVAQSFNPWQGIRPDGSGYQDVGFTLTMMDAFCSKFPRRAVIANNSIRAAGLGMTYSEMYEHMKMLHDTTGRAVRFQTATKPRVGDYAATLDWALLHGAHAVELSPGVQDCSSRPCLSAAQLAAYDAKLRNAG